MLFFAAAYRTLRRAMENDQRTPSRFHPPLWRLLLEEIALLAARVGRWLVSAVAASVAATVLAVLVGLSHATPGPSLAFGWRVVVAATCAVAVVATWAVAHALRREREAEAH